jgi:hypothetical protein
MPHFLRNTFWSIGIVSRAPKAFGADSESSSLHSEKVPTTLHRSSRFILSNVRQEVDGQSRNSTLQTPPPPLQFLPRPQYLNLHLLLSQTPFHYPQTIIPQTHPQKCHSHSPPPPKTQPHPLPNNAVDLTLKAMRDCTMRSYFERIV